MKPDWRQYLLKTVVLGMESCWLVTILLLLNDRIAGGYLSIPYLWFFFPASSVFHQLLGRIKLPRVLIYSVSSLALTIGILSMTKVQLYTSFTFWDFEWLAGVTRAMANVFGIFPSFLLLAAGSIALWTLGWRLARSKVTFTNTVAEFQFGLIALVVTVFAASQFKVSLANVLPTVILFFFFALVGMSLAHSQRAGWSAGPSRNLWLGLLLASIGIILVLGLFLSQLVTPDFLQAVLTPFKWLWGMIAKAYDYLISLIPPPKPTKPLPTILVPQMPAITPGAAQETSEVSSHLFRDIFRLALNILWLAISVVALWRISSSAYGWFHRKLSLTQGAEIEPLRGALRADLLNFLKHIVSSLIAWWLPFRRRKTKSTAHELNTIRQIYAHVLRWAASRGRARLTFQTPFEFLASLKTLVPSLGSEFEFITDKYVSTRYGHASPTAEELARLKQNWEKVSTTSLAISHSSDG